MGDFMNYETKIQEFMNENHGYIATSDFIKMNISKPLIKKYVEKGVIRKVAHGLYIDSNLLQDDNYILQQRYPNAIFSYNTAFYYLNLSYKAPIKIDISINNKKRVVGDYNIHYVSDKYYEIGIVEMKSILGNPIKVYNAERCICDMLKSEKFDLELQNNILDNYFRSDEKDIDRLLEYSKIFNIYDKVNTLVEYAIR